MKVTSLILALVAGAYGFGSNCGSDGKKLAARSIEHFEPMPINFKVAFVGDSGSGTQQRQVFQMVKDFGADLLLQGGDFDYRDDPALWERQINDVLGDDFPLLAVVGNHDSDEWEGSRGYKQRLMDHMDRANLTQYCSGDYGVNFHCVFKGMLFVLSGVGELGRGHEEYMEDAFLNNPLPLWKHCNWHKNMRLYQTGTKTDDTGYEVFEICRENGAFIANHHEHSYARTYTMSNFAKQVIDNKDKNVIVEPGKSFMFVSALGGNSIRGWENNLEKNPWWAALAAEDNGASDGPLLCTFNYNGDMRTAKCTMTDRRGKTFDDFFIYNNNQEGFVPLSTRCRQKKIDVQIDSSLNDIIESHGQVQCRDKIIPLGNGKLALRFPNLPLNKSSKILSSHLEFMGVESFNPSPKLTIRAELNPQSNPFNCSSEDSSPVSSRDLTRDYVSWTKNGEDFEVNTIWPTPDITGLINQVLELDNEDDSLITLTFVLEGESDLSAFTFDGSRCNAPSLTILYEDSC